MKHNLTRPDCLLALRVMATIAVVIGHSASYFGGLKFTQWPQFPYIQSQSVVVFFLVSGWTIAWLLDERGRGFIRYVFDRFCRLAIPLVPTLAFFAIVEYAVNGAGRYYSLQNFIGSALFAQGMRINVLGIYLDPQIQPFGLNRPLWTLSLEFWLYVAFGGAVFAWRGQRIALIVGVFAILLLVGGYTRLLPLIWLFGAVLYHLSKPWSDLTRQAKLALLPFWLIAFSALFVPQLWPADGTYSPTFAIAITANFAFFMLVVPGISIPPTAMRLLVWLGGFAYTTYLVHYPILYMVAVARILPTGATSSLAMSAATFAFAWAFSVPFEQRYRQIRDRIWQWITRPSNPHLQY